MSPHNSPTGSTAPPSPASADDHDHDEAPAAVVGFACHRRRGKGNWHDAITIIFGVFFVPPAAFAALSPFSWWQWKTRDADVDWPSDGELRRIRIGGVLGLLMYAGFCVLELRGYEWAF
ncbi:hypothetical protein AB0I53_38555 [Saccharopolyspora sp. NPDC050389]|uniref:hypothetical protein n=1 Tax=Saccharopolyspora sp. NPDC050389 TaxID=3155516 RepID=UPI0033C3D981